MKILTLYSIGTEFQNMLSMSPIFNKKGEYCYVLGIQCDISGQEPSEQEIQMIDEIAYHISKIPNKLKWN